MDFLSGVIVGILGVIVLGSFLVRKDANKLKQARSASAKDAMAGALRVKDLLKRAAEIAEQQLDLQDQAQQPSANSLHSRFKNGLISEIKRLEEEKIAVLTSIIEEGFDPVVKVSDCGTGVQELPLSEYLLSAGIDVKKKAVAPATADTNKPVEEPRKAGKFYVIKGGKGEA